MGNPDAWDLASAYIGGATLPGGLNRIINYGDFSKDSGAGFIKDPDLLSKWQMANTIATYDVEHVKDVLMYMYDNVYFYPTCVAYNVYVANKDFANVFFAPGTTNVWFNACDFYLG